MSPWQDPQEPEPPRSWQTDVLVYGIAAAIAAFMLPNIIRGIAGEGWNW